MWMSALLDGELPAGEEALLLAALDEDPRLADEFATLCEAHEAMRAHGSAALTSHESDHLTAAILAATAPAAMPASFDGALQLTSLALDDALDAAGGARLAHLLEDVDTARAAYSFAATSALVGDAARSLERNPDLERALAGMSVQVSRELDVIERAGVLASGLLDDELSTAEEAELRTLVAARPSMALPSLLEMQAASFVNEALRVAAAHTAAHPSAARAGSAALHVVDVERAQAAQAASVVPVPVAKPRGFFAELWSGLRNNPLALAGAGACALALVVFHGDSGPPPPPGMSEEVRLALVQAFEERLHLDDAPGDELQVLADNSDTEVEAIEAGTETALVFSTSESNITVIWVPEPEEQGT
jgi:hypothetical protein